MIVFWEGRENSQLDCLCLAWAWCSAPLHPCFCSYLLSAAASSGHRLSASLSPWSMIPSHSWCSWVLSGHGGDNIARMTLSPLRCVWRQFFIFFKSNCHTCGKFCFRCHGTQPRSRIPYAMTGHLRWGPTNPRVYWELGETSGAEEPALYSTAASPGLTGWRPPTQWASGYWNHITWESIQWARLKVLVIRGHMWLVLLPWTVQLDLHLSRTSCWPVLSRPQPVAMFYLHPFIYISGGTRAK